MVFKTGKLSGKVNIENKINAQLMFYAGSLSDSFLKNDIIVIAIITYEFILKLKNFANSACWYYTF